VAIKQRRTSFSLSDSSLAEEAKKTAFEGEGFLGKGLVFKGIEIFVGIVNVNRPMSRKRMIDRSWLVGKGIFFFRRLWTGEQSPTNPAGAI
jgi:hypothetical protein